MQYIAKTSIPNDFKCTLGLDEYAAIAGKGDITRAILLAFQYGRAKGYSMAKSEEKA